VTWVEDAYLDPRFHDNPLVIGIPKIRFYAGAPIHAPNGATIGTICVIDEQPRPFSSREELLLKQLADSVDDLLRLSTGVA
jgi:GAF domain-containing protein